MSANLEKEGVEKEAKGGEEESEEGQNGEIMKRRVRLVLPVNGAQFVKPSHRREREANSDCLPMKLICYKERLIFYSTGS